MKKSYRPSYHFTPPQNWMNDPNGTIYLDGVYHLFYQHNPFACHWGDIHWGHATSTDLMHWQHQPIALTPSPAFGEKHCFSGCVVWDGKLARAFYTSVGEGDRNAEQGAQQWTAVSDDLFHWTMAPGKNVVPFPSDCGLDLTHWRDPFVFQKEHGYGMLLGATYGDKSAVLHYESTDLTKWRFVAIAHMEPGKGWECPNLVHLNGTDVLLCSPYDSVAYMTGRFDSSGVFNPQTRGLIDAGGREGYYATNVLYGPDQKPVLFGWIDEADRGDLPNEDGFAGVQAIPRQIWADESGRVCVKPVPQLDLLKRRRFECPLRELDAGQALPVRSDTAMVTLTIQNPDANFDLCVFADPTGQEWTQIRWESASQTLTLDRSRSSLSGLTGTTVRQLHRERAGELTLRLLLDKSVLELFLDDAQALTARVFPTLPESDGIVLNASAPLDGMIQVDELVL